MQHLCPHCGNGVYTLRSDYTIEQAFRKAYDIMKETMPFLKKLNDSSLQVEWRTSPTCLLEEWPYTATERVSFHSIQDQPDMSRNKDRLFFPYTKSIVDMAYWHRPKGKNELFPRCERKAITWQQEIALGYPFLTYILTKIFSEWAEMELTKYDTPFLALYRYEEREIRGPLLICFFAGIKRMDDEVD